MACTTHFKFMKIQNFSFPKPIMDHIFDNATSEMFKKLNKTCKLVYFKYGFSIVELMEFRMYFQLYKENFSGYNYLTRVSLKKLSNNLWLTDILGIDHVSSILYTLLIPKIARCDLKKLSICSCGNLEFKDFGFLTESGNVECLHLVYTKVVKSDNTEVPIEDIFDRVLKVKEIKLDPCYITNKTMTVLLSQKRKNKIICIWLMNMDKMFDTQMFIQFIKKFADKALYKTTLRINFSFIKDENTVAFKNIFMPFYNKQQSM